MVLIPILILACKDKSSGTIPCGSNSDCPSSQPMCAPDSKICVGCLPNCQNTCPTGQTCNAQTYQCVDAGANPCHCNAECPRPGIDPATAISCDVDGGGVCVGCLSNTDCVLPDICRPDKNCGCNSNADCT